MKDFILFATGMAIGIGITAYVYEKKYKQILNDEIASVKKAYQKQEEEPATVTEEKVVEEYKKIVSEAGYSTVSESLSTPEFEIIEPSEFGMEDDYSEVTLMYYEDRETLTEDDGTIMNDDDIAMTIGSMEPLSHFGEFEPDAVYVRNHGRSIDYEILKVEDADDE